LYHSFNNFGGFSKVRSCRCRDVDKVSRNKSLTIGLSSLSFALVTSILYLARFLSIGVSPILNAFRSSKALPSELQGSKASFSLPMKFLNLPKSGSVPTRSAQSRISSISCCFQEAASPYSIKDSMKAIFFKFVLYVLALMRMYMCTSHQ